MPECCSRKTLKIAILIFFLAMAAYAPQAIKKSYRADFERYYTAGCVAARGADIYGFDGTSDLEFKYFPLFAQIMSPIAIVSEWCATGNAFPQLPSEKGLKIGAGIWYAIICISYLASLWMLVRLCNPKTSKQTLLLIFAGVLLSARFMIGNIRNGQVNVPVLAMGVWGCYMAIRNNQRAAGVILSIGALVKFVPALPLLWLLMRKQFNAVIYFAIATILLLTLLPSLNWSGGINAHMAQLKHYIELRHKMVTDLPEEEAAGQSLPSMINRLLRPVNAWPASLKDSEGNHRVNTINIAVIDERILHWLVLGAVLTVTAFTLWLLRDNHKGLRPILGMSLCFLMMLIISPESRKAHYVSLILPAISLTAASLRSRYKWLYLSTLAATCLTMFGFSRELWKDCDLYHNLNAYGILLWIAILIYIATAIAIREPVADRDECPCDPDPHPEQTPPIKTS